MRRTTRLFVLVATLMLPTAASATPITFVATLLGANEFPLPPTVSTGTGLAVVVLDPAAHSLHVDVTFAGLLSTTMAAHIHCCLPSPFATGTNAMVATTTPTFTGFPLGVTSGTYSHDFDLTLASSYNPAFITSAFNPSGTIAGAEAALEAGIEGGETYLNIHTTNYPGGEIRGFLVAVPEPGTLLLLAAGFAGLGGITWRRHRPT